jgi:hypothetical protein
MGSQTLLHEALRHTSLTEIHLQLPVVHVSGERDSISKTVTLVHFSHSTPENSKASASLDGV